MKRSSGREKSVNKSEFRRIVEKVDVTSFIDYKDYLLEVYRELKAAYESYSYIPFSEDVGLGSCNAMYLITHGTRPLTVKSAQKMVTALGLKKIQRQFFIKLVEASKVKDLADREKSFESLMELKGKSLITDLDKKQLQFFADWFNGAILELLRMDDASDDVEWISQTLQPKVSPSKVKKSLKLLKDLGYIEFSEEKRRLTPSQRVVTTGPEVYGMAVMSYHQQMIQLAKDSIVSVDPDLRDISSLTVLLDAERKEELKRQIEVLRKKIIADSSQGVGESGEIVQVNFQLFPLSKVAKRRDQ